MVRGYWNEPVASAQTFRDGWVRTGDIGRIDEDGCLYVLDRLKDMLIRGGENVYCVEVENALCSHSAVMGAAVIGKPHDVLGQEVAAVVQISPTQPVSEEELIRMAQLGFADIQMQMQSISAGIAKQRGWKSADYRDVMAELGKERIPEAEVLDYYRNILKELETIIRDNELVTLPDREAAIRLATEAESAAAPVPFLSPPQLIGNTGQQGEFVLVTHSPNEEDGGEVSDFGSPASTWSLTAHEARPGHEMQFASMVESGISQARVIYAFNSANVEGWGLYAEAIMQQYLSPEAQLFGLKSRLMRAARAFLDPMLNLGMISKEQALELITNDVGISQALANQEINRYTFRAPGQATSYYYGYMNLMSLRAEVELRMRDRFNQRAYHDFLLNQGLLPPDILRQAVLSDFVAE